MQKQYLGFLRILFSLIKKTLGFLFTAGIRPPDHQTKPKPAHPCLTALSLWVHSIHQALHLLNFQCVSGLHSSASPLLLGAVVVSSLDTLH